MFPTSLVVIVIGLALGIFALTAFAWGWYVGAFRHLDAQARIVLDERDLRLARPWESADQCDARRTAYGRPVAPAPGEWGDGA